MFRIKYLKLSGSNIHWFAHKRVGIENTEMQAVANATAFSCGNTFGTKNNTKSIYLFRKNQKIEILEIESHSSESICSQRFHRKSVKMLINSLIKMTAIHNIRS